MQRHAISPTPPLCRTVPSMLFFCACLALFAIAGFPKYAMGMSSPQQAPPVEALESAAPKATLPAQLTAIQLFQMLPCSIFENTPNPLEEKDKPFLIEYGVHNNWQLVFSGQNQLSIFSLPSGRPQVVMQVFRPLTAPITGEAIVAIGTAGTELCAMELWHYRPPNRLVPLPLPGEPTLEDFFNTKTTLPPDTTASFMICLDGHYLEAYPMLWGSQGPIEKESDKTVHYVWTGTEFVKKIAPIYKHQPSLMHPMLPSQPLQYEYDEGYSQEIEQQE